MGTIVTWGTHQIQETELKTLRFTYGLRLAKINTVFENPLIQYVGKDVVRVKIVFRTTEEDKSYNIWNEKQALTASIRNLNIGGTNFGDFYLSNTEIEYITHSYQMVDNTTTRVTPSTLIIAEVTVEGVQEMPIT